MFHYAVAKTLGNDYVLFISETLYINKGPIYRCKSSSTSTQNHTVKPFTENYIKKFGLPQNSVTEWDWKTLKQPLFM